MVIAVRRSRLLTQRGSLIRRIGHRLGLLPPEEQGHQLVLDHLKHWIGPLVLVEVGTTRELLPGHDSTAKLATRVRELGGQFVTVDMDSKNTKAARPRLAAIDDSFEAVTAKGEDFLRDHEGPIHAVYLDAFDIDHDHHSSTRQARYQEILGTPISDDACHQMHLECAIAVASKVAEEGFVVFDDTWPDGAGGWEGKGALAVPRLLSEGYAVSGIRRRAVALARSGRSQRSGELAGGG